MYKCLMYIHNIFTYTKLVNYHTYTDAWSYIFLLCISWFETTIIILFILYQLMLSSSIKRISLLTNNDCWHILIQCLLWQITLGITSDLTLLACQPQIDLYSDVMLQYLVESLNHIWMSCDYVDLTSMVHISLHNNTNSSILEFLIYKSLVHLWSRQDGSPLVPYKSREWDG